MLALVGIIALLIFVFLRPQEVFPALRTLPFLHLSLAAAVVGFLAELLRGKLTPKMTPLLPWALLFTAWTLFGIVLRVPSGAGRELILDTLIIVTLFMVIAHSIESFRSFALLATSLAFLSLALASIGVHQAYAPLGCVELDADSDRAHLGEGEPDGRSCTLRYECYDFENKPDTEYLCERIGLLGTTTIDGRVRYRGVLKDPNELAFAISCGLPFLFALAGVKRKFRWRMIALAGFAITLLCVIKTQSRGGQVALLAVLGVYFVKRYRWKGILLGLLVVIPLLAYGGRSGAKASESTQQRYEAWQAGLVMFRSNPGMGVGHGMFGEHHYLTAHNSYVLAAAELGLIGMFFWLAVIYLAFKIALGGIRGPPEADDPEIATWGTALLASLTGASVSMLFLSLTYHPLIWIYCGAAGAYYTVVKRQHPDWSIRFRIADAAILLAMCVGLLLAIAAIVRLKGY